MNQKSIDDQHFLKQLESIVEYNLKNEKFGVAQLAEAMDLSRSALHRHLKRLTQKSVSQYIREQRLQKALEMLSQDGKTVAEISYEVGFSSPAYFNHCFHEHYGYPPGESKKHLKNLQHGGKRDENGVRTLVKAGRSFLLKRIGIAAVLVVVVLAGWLVIDRWMVHSPRDLSIAILRFENLSSDDNSRYFADGIREDIINDLQWITALKVVSRTSTDQFIGNNYSIREIAKKLKVRYIVEGSVRRMDGKVRISVQLIDAREDVHLWSDNFDRNLEDIMGVQSQIALQVANNLKTAISEDEQIRIERISTRSAEAYDNYLKARFFLHRANSPERMGFDQSGVRNCIRYYEKAIEADPNFAEAYAGLANASFNLSAWGFINNREGFLKAREMSMKALEIDPECAEAHAVLGAFLVWAARDFENGGRELKTSVELNPNFATSRQWYAQYLMITGPISEARIQENKAVELEPYFWVVKNLDAWIAYFEKDYKRSLIVANEAHDYNPNYPDNMWLFFLNYVKLHEGENARDQLKKIDKQFSSNGSRANEIDEAYEKKGIDGLFEWMIAINKSDPIAVEGLNGDYFYLAWWNAILKHTDQALYWLDENLTYKRPDYHYFNLILFHPDFEYLHDELRFRVVVDKLGLSRYWINVRS
ncbi:helix-turn-helix domain-containing protein [Maribellus mangrovi]|uniref:helix-turn-helix domain-containing protein n=1 Tax=Maribellus mangrovi TaxID=3133146 RepID=UPI0030EC6D45